METRKTAVRICQADFFRLCKWLYENRSDITRNSLSLPVVSQLASKQLGVPIAEASIKNALKTVGIKLARKKTDFSRRNHRDDQIAAIREAIIGLHSALNHPLPERFLERTLPYVKRGDDAINGKEQAAPPPQPDKVGSRPDKRYVY